MTEMSKKDNTEMAQLILLGQYGEAISLWRSHGGDKLDLLSSIVGFNQVLFKEFRDFILTKYQGSWDE